MANEKVVDKKRNTHIGKTKRQNQNHFNHTQENPQKKCRQIKSNSSMNSKISVMVVNCRSIRNKVDKFRSLLETYQPNIVIAVETWLTEGFTEKEIAVDGYEFYRRDRVTHGGGIMVGFKTGIKGAIEWTDEEAEMMGFKVKTNEEKYFQLIAIYRPPNAGEAIMKKLLSRIQATRKGGRVIVAGDINLPDVKWIPGGNGDVRRRPNQKIVSDIMNEGFIQVVEEGTRISPSGRNSILDVILVKPEELWLNTTLVEGISDHKVPIANVLLGPEVHVEKAKTKVWYYKKAIRKEVRKEFRDRFISWETTEKSDVELMWSEFKNICDEIRENCVPSKYLTSNEDPVYYNRVIRRLKRKCRRIHTQTKRYGNEGKKLSEIREELQKEKEKAKNQYMRGMFDENDVQQSWNKMYKYVGGQKGNSSRNVPTLIDEQGNEWEDDIGKAEALNNHYAGVFNNTGNEGYVFEGPMRAGEDVPISDAEVWNVIRKLKMGKSPGIDKISNDFIKLAGVEIVPYLVHMFNTSIQVGKLPSSWKNALVVPIYKGGGRAKVGNYRPVSLTSMICKILERVLDIRIKAMMDLGEGFTEKQHGFRKEYSCESQLLGFQEDLAAVLDKGGRVDAVFLDFRKAFDTVDHTILMLKLWRCLGNVKIVNWIGDFLKDRVQSVKVNRKSSQNIRVTSGVPQGSVLGPLLFNIFVNDIVNNINSNVRLFADDCVVYKEISNANDESVVQTDLDEISKWVKINRMGLNIDKCKYLRFGKGKKEGVGNYSISGMHLKEVENYKYLGVVFNKDLTWKDQVEKVTKKGITSLNFVFRQLNGVDIKIKEHAYKSLIRPIMEYATSVWDPYRQGEIKEVEKVQRLAARRVTGHTMKWHMEKNKKGDEVKVFVKPSELVKQLEWDSLEKRRKEDRLCNYFRAMQGRGGWKELYTKIKMDTGERNCRRDNGRKVILKGSRKDVGKYSFLNRTSGEWNKLDGEVFHVENGQEPSVHFFRRNIKSINCN
jgi:hypothetical protein